MSDARIAVGLPAHPKTKKLIRRLGAAGAWRLVCLFLWCAANRSDGDLSGMSDEDIELAVDWEGEEGAFVAALREVAFIDGGEHESSIHDWAEHNPWVADSEARSEKARWAALCKRYGRSGASERMPEYAERITKTQPVDATSGNEDANSTPTATPDSATSMPLAESSNAPSPSPSPSPSPIPNNKNPLSADADRAGDDPPPKPDKPDKLGDSVKEIFDYWRDVMKSPRSVLDDKRRKVIRVALQAGHTVEDLRRAILGCSLTPHNMGQNDRGQKYNGIELILRNADQIDRFIANAGGAAAADGAGLAPLDQLRGQFPGQAVVQLDGGRFRVGSRLFKADGSPEVVL